MNGLELTVRTKWNMQTVSARELHEKLEVRSQFTHWFERMCEYGFIENEDYKLVSQKKLTNNPKNPETEYKDYAVSVDMAKQICMLQRNEKGMQYRRYLLEVEKRYKEKMSLEYKQERDKSKKVRNIFTDTLHRHGYIKNYEYINTTKAMKKELGITVQKDNMTVQELAAVSASEWLSMAMLTDESGYHEVNPVCIKASDTVAGAIEENRRVAIA